jgi:hypothetical protein
LVPELCRLGAGDNIRITINWRDHPPPHVHAELRGKTDATVGIESLAIEDGTLRKKERDLVIEWVTLRQADLRVAWERASRRINPGKVEPLR